METKQQNYAQQLQQAEERATRAEEKERATRAEERATSAERELQELKRELQEQKRELQELKRELHQQRESYNRATTAEERATTAEEKATTAEERATRAEERATRAEQRLLETAQQNNALQQQIRLQGAEERAIQSEDRNSDYMKSAWWGVKQDEIEVMEGKPLGVGGWGEVRVAMFHGIKVAAKHIHEAIVSPHNVSLFLREINIAASVRHPNIVLFIGASLDDYKPVIITELMSASLQSIIEKLSQGQVVSIGTDVASGLNYLHLMRPDPIIRRDVNSANVLLEPIGSGNWKTKICDFGSANFVSKVTTTGPGNASYATQSPPIPNCSLQSWMCTVMAYRCWKWPLDSSQTTAYVTCCLTPCCHTKRVCSLDTICYLAVECWGNSWDQRR